MKTTKLLLFLASAFASVCLCAGPAGSAVYFTEDFETNSLSAWTISRVDTGCSGAATGSFKNGGSYGYTADDTNSTSTNWYSSCVEKYFGPAGDVYARFYVLLKTGFLAQLNTAGWEEVKLFRLNTSSDNIHMVFGVNRSGSVNRFVLTESLAWTNKQYAPALAENTWYCIEMHVSSPTSSTAAEWWVNGTTQTAFTGLSMAAGLNWSWIRMGVFEESKAAYLLGTAFDDVVLSTTYNGPSVPPAGPGTLQFTGAAYSAAENGGNAAITVSRSGGSTGVVGVSYATGGGTAASGSDYTPASGTLTWQDGDSANKTFNVAVIDNSTYGGNKTVSLALSAATGGATIGTPASAVLTIADNESAPAGNEHVWLHVDGKYIMTSPVANPPNQIWMGAGVHWAISYYGGWRTTFYDTEIDHDGTGSAAAKWMAAKGCNLIRVAFASMPYPTGSGQGQGGPAIHATIGQTISDWLVPIVDQLKAKQIYSLLDMHEQLQIHISTSELNEPWTSRPAFGSAEIATWISHWTAIATYFKDEPWVIGYEIINEPCPGAIYYPWPPPGSVYTTFRNEMQQCMAAIRQIDKRHIIVDASFWGHMEDVMPTWSPISFKSDEPYGQAVFAIHPYYYVNCGFGGIGKVSQLLDNVQNNYNVPMMTTEFGNLNGYVPAGWPAATPAVIEQYEKDTIDFSYNHRMPWMIWAMQTGDWPSGRIFEYDTAWNDRLTQQVSLPPVGGGVLGGATRLSCAGFPRAYALANGTDIIGVKSTVCNPDGYRVMTAINQVTFTISGNGTWDDGTTAPKSAFSDAGLATLGIKAGSTAGKITITASAAGLAGTSVDIPVIGAPAKVRMTAGVSSLPADGTTMTIINAYLKDTAGNVCVNISTGLMAMSVDPATAGSMWYTASSPANTGTVANGVASLYLKAGTAAGTAKVTGTYGSISGSVNVGVGIVLDTFPNLVVVNEGSTSSEVKFSGLSDDAELSLYTLSGKLVKTMRQGDFGAQDMAWNKTNLASKAVVRGIYVYTLKDASGARKTGKILVR